jgi:hypothetical protein
VRIAVAHITKDSSISMRCLEFIEIITGCYVMLSMLNNQGGG